MPCHSVSGPDARVVRRIGQLLEVRVDLPAGLGAVGGDDRWPLLKAIDPSAPTLESNPHKTLWRPGKARAEVCIVSRCRTLRETRHEPIG